MPGVHSDDLTAYSSGNFHEVASNWTNDGTSPLASDDLTISAGVITGGGNSRGADKFIAYNGGDGATNVILEIKLELTTDSTRQRDIAAVRWVNATNWVGIRCTGGGVSGLRLTQNVSGSLTDLVTAQSHAGRKVKVVDPGGTGTLQLYEDDGTGSNYVLIGSAAGPAGVAGGKHGLVTRSNASYALWSGPFIVTDMDDDPPSVSAASLTGDVYGTLTIPAASITASDDVGLNGYQWVFVAHDASAPSAPAVAGAGWQSLSSYSPVVSGAGWWDGWAFARDTGGQASTAFGPVETRVYLPSGSDGVDIMDGTTVVLADIDDNELSDASAPAYTVSLAQIGSAARTCHIRYRDEAGNYWLSEPIVVASATETPNGGTAPVLADVLHTACIITDGGVIDVSATDVDGTTPAIQISAHPDFVTFNPLGDGEAEILIEIEDAVAGIHEFIVTAIDEIDPALTDSQEVFIAVIDLAYESTSATTLEFTATAPAAGYTYQVWLDGVLAGEVLNYAEESWANAWSRDDVEYWRAWFQENTGPTVALNPTPLTGTQTITTQGQADALVGRIIEGQVVVQANVTLHDFKILGQGDDFPLKIDGNRTCTIYDIEIDGQNEVTTTSGIGGSSFATVTCDRIKITGCTDGFRTMCSSTYTHMYVGEPFLWDDAEQGRAWDSDLDPHCDGFQAVRNDEGVQTIVRQSFIDMGPHNVAHVSACLIKTDSGVIDDFVVEDCYLNGGGHTATISALGANGAVTDCVFQRNRFGHDYGTGIWSLAGGQTITRTANVWADTGDAVPTTSGELDPHTTWAASIIASAGQAMVEVVVDAEWGSFDVTVRSERLSDGALTTFTTAFTAVDTWTVFIQPTTGALRFNGTMPTARLTKRIAPLVGRLAFNGQLGPSPNTGFDISPSTGILRFNGNEIEPFLYTTRDIAPITGSLIFRGEAVEFEDFIAVDIAPSTGALYLRGEAMAVSAQAWADTDDDTSIWVEL